MVELKPLLLPQQLEPRFLTTKRRLEDYRTPPASPKSRDSGIGMDGSSATNGFLSPPTTPTRVEHSNTHYSQSFPPTARHVLDEPNHIARVNFFTRGTGLSDLVEEPCEVDHEEQRTPKSRTQQKTKCFPGGHVTILAPLSGELELPRVYSSSGTYSEIDTTGFRPSKKRRGGESPFAGFATRLSDRFPVFARHWKGRRDGRPGSRVQSPSWTRDYRGQVSGLPPTPVASSDEDEDEDRPEDAHVVDEIDGTKDLSDLRKFARSPLLPPIMTKGYEDTETLTTRSPLAPPSVAPDIPPVEPTTTSVFETPSTPTTDQTTIGPCGPTPPLSTRPSLSSLRNSHQAIRSPPSALPSSADIPPLLLNEAPDAWTAKLGQANFSIHPEPHKPTVCDLETCKQLKLNWETARCNFARHLFRVGEHYGDQSTVYRLTQEKWATIHAEWLVCMRAAVRESKGDTLDLLAEMDGRGTVVAMPPVIDHRNDSKFPKLGDEDIVGPMEMAVSAARIRRKPSKRAAVIRFLREI